jgi:preprotein translocase subunit SecA
VLNAKNDEEEAAVIAEAGAPGAVTISTNMAGRGTDIRLGGRDEAHRAEVAALGGLYVIGTNRHESLRVDRQLRGRAGRQGDPGSSRFFIALDDDLIERFGVKNLIPSGRRPENREEPLESRVIRREIDRAQRIVEGQNVDTRKTLCKYAEVLESQRRYLQDWRQAVLKGEEVPALLAEQAREKWGRLVPRVGAAVLAGVERTLTLLVTDRCWSDYLAEMTKVRDGIHLASLGAKDPYTEYHREAREAFPHLLEGIDREIVETFRRVEVSADGVDWAAEGLLGPSSTWTYLVTDQPFKTGLFGSLAARPAAGIYAAAIFGPFLAAAMVIRAWQLRRRKKAEARQERDGTG